VCVRGGGVPSNGGENGSQRKGIGVQAMFSGPAAGRPRTTQRVERFRTRGGNYKRKDAIDLRTCPGM